ncbi:MAG: amidohydrolase family protein [Oscillibacter sp.]|nr:amidohydrolase family protein [Oscillibacter sp.]MEA4994521.1 amidohydrolase family protein [Oscillibacter sp.]
MTTRKGMDGWFPEERVTVYEAASMYTRNAAFVSYKEDRKGTIEPGKLADFVLLDTDVFRTETEKIKDICVKKPIRAENSYTPVNDRAGAFDNNHE